MADSYSEDYLNKNNEQEKLNSIEEARIAEIQARQDMEDIKLAINHAPSRRFISRILTETNFFQAEHKGGSRNVGVFIMGCAAEAGKENLLKLIGDYYDE